MILKLDDIQKGERGIRKRVLGLKVLSALEAVGLGTIALVLVVGAPTGNGELAAMTMHVPSVLHGLFSTPPSSGGMLFEAMGTGVALVSLGLGVARQSIWPVLGGVMMAGFLFFAPQVLGFLTMGTGAPGQGASASVVRAIIGSTPGKRGILDQTPGGFMKDTPQVMASYLPVFRKEGGAALAAGELVLAENYVIHRETGSAHPVFLDVMKDLNGEQPGSPASLWMHLPGHQDRLAKLDRVSRFDVPFGEKVAREKMLTYQNAVANQDQRMAWGLGTAAALLLFMLSKMGLWRSMEKRAKRLPSLLEEIRENAHG